MRSLAIFQNALQETISETIDQPSDDQIVVAKLVNYRIFFLYFINLLINLPMSYVLEYINWKYVLIPFISAFIGWLTNWVAVKMLFHPKRPIKVGFFILQGIFHRRQKDIALKLGDTIESKLFSHNDIYEILTSESFKKTIIPVIERSLEDFVYHKLARIHPMLAVLPETIFYPLKGKLIEVFENLIPELMSGAGDVLEDQINIKEVIQEKIENFDVAELEDILFSILKSEFKVIEYTGGVLGFFIGITQLIIIHFL